MISAGNVLVSVVVLVFVTSLAIYARFSVSVYVCKRIQSFSVHTSPMNTYGSFLFENEDIYSQIAVIRKMWDVGDE